MVLKIMNEGQAAVTKEISLLSLDKTTQDREIGHLVPRECRTVSFKFMGPYEEGEYCNRWQLYIHDQKYGEASSFTYKINADFICKEDPNFSRHLSHFLSLD